MKPTIYAPFLALLIAGGCSDYTAPNPPPPPPPPPPAFTTFETLGDSVSIGAKLTEFRTALGGVLNAPNSPPADSGRREINWDGVPAALTDVDTFPANFFNNNSKRGAVYSTPGTGLRVDSTNFAAVNPGLAAQFTFFSPKKLFMPVGSNQVDVTFKVVGTATPGLVKGFGAVFVDVDSPGSTKIEFFDVDGGSLGVVTAPNHGGTQLLSFVGAVFEAPIVARVRITSGAAALTPTIADVSDGGAQDLVVMDDFVFGEPRAAGPDIQVTVGNTFFRSVQNNSQNPAVDTIAAGARVTWTWNAAGSHSIQSTGIPPEVFRNSVVMNRAGDTYSVRLFHPGTYEYDCAVHGAAMTGRIVVK
ncbi:MAG TPA: plastocyanin/azurin family copper-binding protein [Gemmatimonadales bacterium]|jgi:plastocyanin|nr:plastocyanin/azurin family copper-binding protein [Gemmatimonadales bacterium]